MEMWHEMAQAVAEKGDICDKEGRRAKWDSQSALQGRSNTHSALELHGRNSNTLCRKNAITDNFDWPARSDPGERIQALHGLHLSEVIEFNDGVDKDGQNDIDIPTEGSDNKDYTMRIFRMCSQTSSRNMMISLAILSRVAP